MPNDRYASFDYCFNYFQFFRESGEISALAAPANLQDSCLQLGFYLASWGMYQGSTQLLKNSLKYLVPLIKVVARTDVSLWEIDAHCYTESNIDQLLQLRCAILQAYPNMTPALLTKSMLGVFGNVPAFDTNFRQACRAAGIDTTFGPKALEQIGVFYQENASLIDSYRHQLSTLDFVTGEHTHRSYTRAKLIDMAFFIEGGA